MISNKQKKCLTTLGWGIVLCLLFLLQNLLITFKIFKNSAFDNITSLAWTLLSMPDYGFVYYVPFSTSALMLIVRNRSSSFSYNIPRDAFRSSVLFGLSVASRRRDRSIVDVPAGGAIMPGHCRSRSGDTASANDVFDGECVRGTLLRNRTLVPLLNIKTTNCVLAGHKDDV